MNGIIGIMNLVSHAKLKLLFVAIITPTIISFCTDYDAHKIMATDRIVFGCTVTICNIDTDEELTYVIVGEDESDLKQGRISIASPIARALIGRSVGDEASVQAPTGEIIYEIMSIKYI